VKKLALLLTAVAVTLTPAAAIAGGKDKDKDAAPAVLPAVPAGKGLVAFFRPGGMGGAVRCTIRENGHMVTRVMGNRFDPVVVEPGTHSFTTKTEATDTVTVQVEPDEITDVKCKISMGLMVGRPNLSASTEQEWAQAAPKLKSVDKAKLAEDIAKDEAELAAKPAETAAK
jgi:hypothetical protein